MATGNFAGPTARILTDPCGCGAGQGNRCCIFIVVGRQIECHRDGPLRENCLAHRPVWTAQRVPIEPFPACRIFSADSGQGDVRM